MKKFTDTGPDFKKASRKQLKAEFETLGALVQEHQGKRKKHKRKEEEAKAKVIQLEVHLKAAEVLLHRWLIEGDPFAYYHGEHAPEALQGLVKATTQFVERPGKLHERSS